MRRESLLVLACLLAGYLIFGSLYVWVLGSSDYEAEYLALGSLALRGEIGLFQDELTGHWVPLPFWLYGATQLAFGPSLLPPRLLSLGLSTLVLVLTFRIAERWGGLLAATAAGALFATHGMVMGYFMLADFSPMTALLHLAGIWVIFCTGWRHRDLIGMALVSLLFLVKPNYWPTVPFVLAYLAWRAESWSRRASLLAVALAVPLLFFVSARDHLKLLAYVPVLKEWVRPLGYTSWFPFVEDPAEFWRTEYTDLPAGTTPLGRFLRVVLSGLLLLRRYALWAALLVGLVALHAWRGRRREPWPPGVAFSAWLFGYLILAQFVVVGPWTKQAFGYVGAVSPLIVIVIGWLLARVVEEPAVPGAARAVAATAVVLAVVASPWVHRQPSLPRTLSLRDATVPALGRLAGRLAALIPADETRVFLLGDALPLHLAGRRSYLRQYHQWWIAFTSSAEPARYRKAGLWGVSELEGWLGADARWAIFEERALRFYRARAPYRAPLARMEELLARHFDLVETLGEGGTTLFVYRRR
jgi:hypothetical protein